MLKRHAAYLDFVASWFGEPQPLPWWQRVIDIRGTRLHVAGLDFGLDDLRRSGPWQSPARPVPAQPNDGDPEGRRRPLAHRPAAPSLGLPRRFRRPPRPRGRPSALRHTAARSPSLSALRARSAAGPDTRLPGAGRRLCLRKQPYPNAFQWIELSPTGKRVRCHFRAWLHGAWTIDRNQPNCPEGHAEFGYHVESRPAAVRPASGPVRVLISYSHDTKKHMKRALDLANRLRQDGVDAYLDQYQATPPPEGWPYWYEKQIEAADFVLIVCSKNYTNLLSHHETNTRNLSVLWERRLVLQLLYDAGSVRQKFVPILFAAESSYHIPLPLRDVTSYAVWTDRGYEALIVLLTGQPFTTRPRLEAVAGATQSFDRPSRLAPSRGGPAPLRESKMILVGPGGVGKTSLVNRLVHGTLDAQQPMTRGIEITDWDVSLTHREKILVHIWDFGGQEILHATHQFFFTQRSLYLLVLAGRHGNEDAEAEYWINLITGFAQNSPVLVVLNKSSAFPFSVNRRALEQKYSLRAFVETDCETLLGLAYLERCIYHEIDVLPIVRDEFPPAWFSIKDRLIAMREDYISFDKFRSICDEEGEKDRQAQDKLAWYMHVLGIVLNYRDDARLQDTHVLNPHWITQAIYTILSHSSVAKQKGKVALRDLENILNAERYPRERHAFILELMRKFELCFPFPDNDDLYLIPQLLSKEEPIEAEKFDGEQCLFFEFQYPTILPEGIIPRFIVRTFTMSNERSRWRSGVILTFEGNNALIKADFIGREVRGPRLEARREGDAAYLLSFEMTSSEFTGATRSDLRKWYQFQGTL